MAADLAALLSHYNRIQVRFSSIVAERKAGISARCGDAVQFTSDTDVAAGCVDHLLVFRLLRHCHGHSGAVRALADAVIRSSPMRVWIDPGQRTYALLVVTISPYNQSHCIRPRNAVPNFLQAFQVASIICSASAFVSLVFAASRAVSCRAPDT